MRCFSLLLGLCFLALTAVASAHETWLLPASFSTPPDREVALDLTSGMKFPTNEYAIIANRIAKAGLRLGTNNVALKDFKPLDQSLRLTPQLPREGLATVWVELHPLALELADDKVTEYLEEIGATDETRAAWARLKGHHPWTETYTKFAKTFIAVGNVRSDQSWREPVGMGLEIVPVSNPLELRVGQTACFKLLAKGKPLAAAPIGLMAEGATGRTFRKTDKAGFVTFPIERTGKTLIFAVDLRSAKNGTSWESDFTTLTVQVAKE
jgi:uncharacterized GH25 family protein